MAVFDFPYHIHQDEYPESSAQVRFGRGYQFASKPIGPDQITFRLHFDTMFWITELNGTLSATTTFPAVNLRRLVAFYETHRMFETFVYPHPTRGNATCRFARPFTVPKQIKNSMRREQTLLGQTVANPVTLNLVEPFELVFILQP